MRGEIERLVELVIDRLVEINAGTCSITDADVFAEPDIAVRQVLTGLRMLHEDRIYQDRERARRDALVRETTEQFRQLVESAGDAFFLSDAEGRIVQVNEESCRTLGRSRSELTRLTIDEVRLVSSPRDAGLLEQVWESREAITVAGVHRRLDGTQFPVEIRARTVARDGRRYLLSLARDVSARLHLEDQLRQAQKMDAIGNLAGGIAHDLNNILTAITTFTTFVVDELRPEDPAFDDLHQVLRASDRASTLTRQLLAFSRRQTIQPEPLDLNEIVRDLGKMLSRLIGEHVTLESELDADLWTVFADPSALEQVLVNLVVNARDAMPDGGTIRISTSNTKRRRAQSPDASARQQEYVCLTVTDTGIGMDPQTLQQVFDPFYTTKPTGKGTGLGLSMAHGIVEQASGFFEVSSTPAIGTTFSILLPRVEGSPRNVQRQRSGSRRLRGTETILVVEDDETVRTPTLRALRRLGYTVLEAAGSRDAQAISLANPGVIDLLLTDIVMPEMDGRALATLLLQDRPSMRVAFISGYAPPCDASESFVGPIIEKPFSPRLLGERVRAILDAEDGEVRDGYGCGSSATTRNC